VAKPAFDKIKAGLDDAQAYLDRSGDKSRYLVNVFPRENTVSPSKGDTAGFIPGDKIRTV
jgi:hypothetical protein